MISTLLLILACSSTASTQNDARQTIPAPAAASAPSKVAEPADFRRQFVEVARTVRPSVVAIAAVSTVEVPGARGLPFGLEGSPFEHFFRMPGRGGPRKQKRRGMGSGVIVDAQGTILTNNHVVDGADELTVVLDDDRELDAEILGTDPKTDVAVIRVKPGQPGADNLRSAAFGDSDELEVGEWVMAIGAPFGLKQTVSAGIVSAVGRGNMGIADYEDFIQTDAAINPGNSGGPLVGLDGRVVGINTAIASRTGGNQGIGFAIPINMARSVMHQLLDGGSVTRGYLGVYIADLSKDLAESFGFEGDDGVLIQDVGEQGPAAEAGLKAGDIVYERDGKPVEDVVTFRNGIAQTPPGTKVALGIWRDGKKKSIAVTLGTLPGDEQQANVGKPGKARKQGRWGLGLGDVTPELAQRFELGDARGALVMQVRPESPAAEAGLRPGDLIGKVKGKRVASAKEAVKLLRDAGDGPLRLWVIREGRGRFVLLRPSK
jgi:serine protease Do